MKEKTRLTPDLADEGDREGRQLDRLERVVMASVVEARERWTAGTLERHIVGRIAFPRAQVRCAIRGLIARGLLEYSYLFGQSYLAMSFRQAVDVGERFAIVPSGYAAELAPHRLPLVIAAGASFGSGHHATTRLALQALEKGWSLLHMPCDPSHPSVIDIGTGSGILAIAAARLGAGTVTALDIDPCARSEARHNIALNPGIPHITVSSAPHESLDSRFTIAIANLRTPTLRQLAEWITTHVDPTGYLVVSGLREEEWQGLTAFYAEKRLESLWRKCQAGWCAGVFRLTGRAGVLDEGKVP